MGYWERRNELKNIFEDTRHLCEADEKLKKAIEDTNRCQYVLKEEEQVKGIHSNKRYSKEAEIKVTNNRTFQAAQSYSGMKTCVLNFASATSAGGGVLNGASAQEECLCRCSTLYFNLTQTNILRDFHKRHRYYISNNKMNSLYNDDCIYTPGVKVFKTDTARPELMDEKEWYSVDVITCAAPNLRSKPSNEMNPFGGKEAAVISNEELKRLHLKRARRIFDIAKAEGEEVVILGAFGCGAFRNPAKVVADAMITAAQDYLYDFKVIEFAIYCTPRDMDNYNAFYNASETLIKKSD